jgi:hypothetical protein
MMALSIISFGFAGALSLAALSIRWHFTPLVRDPVSLHPTSLDHRHSISLLIVSLLSYLALSITKQKLLCSLLLSPFLVLAFAICIIFGIELPGFLDVDNRSGLAMALRGIGFAVMALCAWVTLQLGRGPRSVKRQAVVFLLSTFLLGSLLNAIALYWAVSQFSG